MGKPETTGKKIKKQMVATHIVPIQYQAIALLGLIVYVGYDLYRQITENRLETE